MFVYELLENDIKNDILKSLNEEIVNVKDIIPQMLNHNINEITRRVGTTVINTVKGEASKQAATVWNQITQIWHHFTGWFTQHFPNLTKVLSSWANTIVTTVKQFSASFGHWAWPLVGGAIVLILFWWLYRRFVKRKVAVENVELELSIINDYINLVEVKLPFGLTSLDMLLNKALKTANEILDDYNKVPEDKKNPLFHDLYNLAKLQKDMILNKDRLLNSKKEV